MGKIFLLSVCSLLLSGAIAHADLRQEYDQQESQPTSIKGCRVEDMEACKKLFEVLQVSVNDVAEVELHAPADNCDVNFVKLKSGKILENVSACW